ncbi:MAG TPA: hypothetical protein VFV50_18185, partial [Bdellovibrionales bacterium]|nr:hypothetical protein [Bdellovibrionales bacterium]
MSASFENFKLGQLVWATVEETPGEDHILVNFDGSYLPVLNTSDTALVRGQKIQMVVESLAPLRFRLIN